MFIIEKKFAIFKIFLFLSFLGILFFITQQNWITLLLTAFVFAGFELLTTQLLRTVKKQVDTKTDFLIHASHELRAPMTIIRGFAEAMQDFPHPSPEIHAEITEKILRACIRFEKLAKSLLTLSDIENNFSSSTEVSNLIPILENCKTHLLSLHPNAQISIKTKLQTAQFRGDASLIELAIWNLLENGIKYSKSSAHIEMILQRTEDQLKLEIIDQGIGIAKDTLPLIFEKFHAVDKRLSRKLGGAGLGLSIVKSIVERHQGQILVTSIPEKGSNFTLVLPSD